MKTCLHCTKEYRGKGHEGCCTLTHYLEYKSGKEAQIEEFESSWFTLYGRMDCPDQSISFGKGWKLTYKQAQKLAAWVKINNRKRKP